MDSSAFRSAMRNFSGTVCIVATGSGESRVGLTATSVCSLSDNPPMVLVCVNRSAHAHRAIVENKAFSVNFLSAGQVGLADCFAGRIGLKGDARFTQGDWRNLSTGAPVLADSLASFDCTLVSEHLYSTHSIFIGLVKDTIAQSSSNPLIYLRGKFSSVSPLAEQRVAACHAS